MATNTWLIVLVVIIIIWFVWYYWTPSVDGFSVVDPYVNYSNTGTPLYLASPINAINGIDSPPDNLHTWVRDLTNNVWLISPDTIDWNDPYQVWMVDTYPDFYYNIYPPDYLQPGDYTGQYPYPLSNWWNWSTSRRGLYWNGNWNNWRDGARDGGRYYGNLVADGAANDGRWRGANGEWNDGIVRDNNGTWNNPLDRNHVGSSEVRNNIGLNHTPVTESPTPAALGSVVTHGSSIDSVGRSLHDGSMSEPGILTGRHIGGYGSGIVAGRSGENVGFGNRSGIENHLGGGGMGSHGISGMGVHSGSIGMGGHVGGGSMGGHAGGGGGMGGRGRSGGAGRH
jgi:hypothetical protein